MKESVVRQKSFAFAVRCVNLYKYLVAEKHEYVLSKQLLRSGTSIGANIREAQRGQSKPDFRAKMCIALKEADETCYWLELLAQTGFLSISEFENINSDCDELIAILTSIVKSAK